MTRRLKFCVDGPNARLQDLAASSIISGSIIGFVQEKEMRPDYELYKYEQGDK